MSSNTKWTPGQLAYIDALCKTHHQPTYSEMAEAILAYGDNPSIAEPRTLKEHDAVCALAQRLRGIGANE